MSGFRGIFNGKEASDSVSVGKAKPRSMFLFQEKQESVCCEFVICDHREKTFILILRNKLNKSHNSDKMAAGLRVLCVCLLCDQLCNSQMFCLSCFHPEFAQI